MGKKKSDIYVCFQILPYKNKANKSIFQCKFCDRQYLQNATKMESHIITQCQKVPAAIRASYTTKPGNGGGGGAAAALAGLNLSLMTAKHDDLDINDLFKEYSDSSASEAPEQMVVNVSVPAMLRLGKGSSAAGNSGGGGRGGGGNSSNNHHSHGGLQRNVPPPKNSPPTFSSLGYTAAAQNLISDFNQRSMQIRAYSQLVGGLSSNMNNGSSSNSNSSGGNSRKRARVDNHTNNNNNNVNNLNNNNNNNYYTIGNAGSANKILIKPSHGVPAAKLPNLGNNARNSNSNNLSATAATLTPTASAGATAILNNRKLKSSPIHLSGATITKNANLNNNNNNISSGLREKLSREETVEIWRLLARAVYSSEVPITILENEHWINVLQRIQPSLTLPSTSVLTNALLDQEYARIGQDIEEKVEKSHFSVLECITVPGTRPNEITLVFFLTCDDSPNPYLYKTHHITDPDGYNKDGLSKIIEDTILDIGLTKVVAFMSDLTIEMEGTWEILRDKFPGLLTFGCVTHGLNSILDKILTLPEVSKMVEVVKKLYYRIDKSTELKSMVEEALGRKCDSPSKSEEAATNNHDVDAAKDNITHNNNANHTKWKPIGKLISQLISDKAVYQQLVGKPEARKVIDGLSSDSPNGKSDRSLSNHLSSESFWTSLHSLNSIIVPCLQWIESLKPDRVCSLSEVPEVFKELKQLLQTHLRNFPVDDTTKQSVQKHFLQMQRKCVNEIHFTASLLNPNQKLRGILTEDEEAQGMEFLTYFCDSRGYHAGSILRELADYKSMSGIYANEKLWKLGQTLDVPSWWKMVQGESALSNIAISIARVMPSCSILESNLLKPSHGDLLDADKTEKLAFIQYNLHKPQKAKLPKTSVVVIKTEVPKETPPPAVIVPAKVEKLRIKLPRKEGSESPAMDLSSARLSGCSQVSDEEEEMSDDDSDDEEESSSVANSVAHNDTAAKRNEQSATAKQQDDDQTSDAEDGSTKDDSSSDSDDSSSDDQSD